MTTAASNASVTISHGRFGWLGDPPLVCRRRVTGGTLPDCGPDADAELV